MPPLFQCKETNPDELVLCRVQPGQVPARLLWLSQRNALSQTDCTEYSGQSFTAGMLPQSHRQQVPTRWKYDLEVTFTH